MGRGGEGVCCRAVDVKKGTLFVIKGNKDCYMSSKLYSECKILSELHHRHVVVFLGAVEEVVDGTVKMFMEFAPCEWIGCACVCALFSSLVPLFSSGTRMLTSY